MKECHFYVDGARCAEPVIAVVRHMGEADNKRDVYACDACAEKCLSVCRVELIEDLPLLCDFCVTPAIADVFDVDGGEQAYACDACGEGFVGQPGINVYLIEDRAP